MKRVRERVQAYVEQHHMLEKEDRVIAGISGGADSVCLLCVLLELKEVLGISLVAVHVNHGLRGADADADERFVREFCERHGIVLETVRVDLRALARSRKQSLEEAGREVRREVFLQVLEQHDGSKIALAHHRNDNAETLLWNLARGTGLRGMSGIRPVNGLWIRPLLCLERAEIEAYLEERGQGYCTDQTNLETIYTRNRLRHRVLPVLEQEINRAAVRHMNEAMEQMCELREYVEAETRRAMECCVTGFSEVTEEEPACCADGACLCRIEEASWRQLPGLLRKEVLRCCLEQAAGGGKDLGRVHVTAAAALFDRRVGSRCDLPGDVQAVREYAGIALTRKRRRNAAGDAGGNAVKVRIPGVTAVPDLGLEIHCTVRRRPAEWKESEIPQKRYTKWFDYDIIKCLYARTRRSGDRIVIDGAGHRKKLKSWFVNEKIPSAERAKIPLLADGEDILWIVGHRMSAAYHVTERTEHILEIEIRGTNVSTGGD